MPVLELSYFNDRPRVIPLRPGRWLLGRDDRADIRLEGHQVSRQMLALSVAPRQVFVTPLSESVPVWLDRERIPPYRQTLVPVDVPIAFGPYVGRVVPDEVLRRETTVPTDWEPVELHAEVLGGTPGGVDLVYASLVFLGGPCAGRSVRLDALRCELGGPRSVLPLPRAYDSPDPRRAGLTLRVTRARVTLEAGAWRTSVGAMPLHVPTPVAIDEVFTAGPHQLCVRTERTRAPATSEHDVVGPLRGCTPEMRRVVGLVKTVGPTLLNVLVRGESGAGKTTVAEALHVASGRPGSLHYVNLSAIAPHLFESELFGHRKGAFTGADADRDGYLHAARGMTILLDEIGDLDPVLQTKLFRFLDTGRFTRVGSTEEEQVDVRVVAATNRDLPAMIARKEFREELYFRVSQVTVELPPLRERVADLPRIANALAARFGASGVTPEALTLLAAFPWYGNVRELESAVEFAAAQAGAGAFLGVQHFADLGTPPERRGSAAALDEPMIRELIGQLGSQTAAASYWGISTSAMSRRVTALGMPDEEHAPRKRGRPRKS